MPDLSSSAAMAQLKFLGLFLGSCVDQKCVCLSGVSHPIEDHSPTGKVLLSCSHTTTISSSIIGGQG